MLRDHLRDKGISIYALARDSGISYSTLNDLVNGKVEIANCKVSLLHKLADALGITMDEVFSLCSEKDRLISNSYNLEVRLMVRNKSYFTKFIYGGAPIELELCKVNGDTAYYIEDIARWRTEAYIRNRRMQEFM
jgi:transcriptional regulator with XRE-family HTH domain